MIEKNENPTSSTPPPGDPQNIAGVGASVGSGVMPASLADLGKRLADAGRGGPLAPAAGADPLVEKRAGLSELTLRVLQRWGALPLKAMAVLTAWTLRIGEEDAELLGECTVDLVRHSSVAPNPRTEAFVRWLGAHAACVGEGYLAAVEERLKKKRAESGVAGA